MKIRYLYLLVVIVFSHQLLAQHPVDLNSHRVRQVERWYSNDSAMHFLSSKPLIISDSSELYNHIYYPNKKPRTKFLQKLRYESLIFKQTKDFRFSGDPILDFEMGKHSQADGYLYRNTRGYYITGRVGKTLEFRSTLFENQVAFEPRVNKWILTNNVIPHVSQFKPYEIPLSSFSQTGYDYTYSEGILSYNPMRHLNFQFGQGRNVIGDGYRSLMLSDNSFSYPYIKATTTFKRFNYVMMFASLLDTQLPQTAESGFHKKRMSMHFFNVNVFKWLQLGVFESIIYNPDDSAGYTKVNANYFNPVILSQTIQYGFNSKNNSLAGITTKIRLLPKTFLYGQFIYDGNVVNNGLSYDKYGLQMGVKLFDAFKVDNLYLQGEYNYVSPYSYSSIVESQNYSHSHQSLAHPLEANFNELTGIVSYLANNFELELTAHLTTFGSDTTGLANSIFASDTLSNNLQNIESPTMSGLPQIIGIGTSMFYFRAEASYIINFKTDLRLVMGFQYRRISNVFGVDASKYVFFGLRTFIGNNLFDY